MRPKAYTRRKELLWLNDLRWYFIQGLDPMVNIQDFFDAPHVQSSWKITRKDLNLVRFGLMWRIFGRSSSSSFLCKLDSHEKGSGNNNRANGDSKNLGLLKS
ncbi:hypothetical protein VNO77_37827 [Canavalia gladiata]|uniref:Uncharacterized protein n=1 Tax=Canavalia gladiata TaxID=3824 RepID=A0AAN9K8J7_CANGL